jgi:hypothetical protein
MSLDIYNEPILGVVGVSAKRLAAVLENNLDMLYRLNTGYRRATG